MILFINWSCHIVSQNIWSLILLIVWQHLVSVGRTADDFDEDCFDQNVCSWFIIYAAPFSVGMISIIFGATAAKYFRHVRAGAWWVGAVIMTCPYISLCLMNGRRFYFSLLIAIGTAAIAFSGTFLDAQSSQHFRTFTACASRGEIYPYKDIIYSGKSSDYLVAKSCYNSTEFIESDGCYCISNNDPRTCTEYVRYSSTKSSTDDAGKRTYYTCYDNIESFSAMMTGSSVICCLALFIALFQMLHITYSLSRWKRRRGVPTWEYQLNGRETEAWPFFFIIYSLLA